MINIEKCEIDFGAIPEEMQGKTLDEAFKLCMEKQHGIFDKIKAIKTSQEIGEVLTLDEQHYLRIISIFKELANGNTQSITGISSPFSSKSI